MIRHVAVVPSTPLVLQGWPGRRHPDVARLAAATGRVLQGIDAADVVLVLAGAPTLALHTDLADPAVLDLSGYGAKLPPHALAAPPAEVVAPLAAVLDAAVWGSRAAMDGRLHIGGGGPTDVPPDLVVLARLLPTGTPAVGVGVPADIGVGDAERLSDVIIRIARDADVAVVAAGDLGAGHGPKPPRPAAAAASAALQDLVVAALDNGRPGDLVRLDAQLVTDSASRGAGALRVLGGILDRGGIGTIVRAAAAPLGVGYVVAQGG